MSSPSPIVPVPDKAAHDRVISEAVETPTVLYLSSSVLPACKSLTPEFEGLAERYRTDGSGLRFCQMEYSSETSPMFKFTQAQLPVVIFVYTERWCKTLLSPTLEEVEAGLEELRGKAAPLTS